MIQIHQGIDIVDITKFKKIATRNEQFVPDIFTQKEKEYCFSRKDPYTHFAGRFAAKEACMKALGWGLSVAGSDHMLRDIEIDQHPSGKPVLFLSGWALKLGQKKRIHQYTVSISHSGQTAVAMVILVGTKDKKT
jgi:holo-[acyl-carrier protein] synthase